MRPTLRCFAIPLWSIAAWAGPLPTPNLGSRAAQADAVILAKLTPGSIANPDSSQLGLQVIHPLYGSLMPGDRIRVHRPKPGFIAMEEPATPAFYGLWLLKKNEDRTFTAVPREPCDATICESVELMPEAAPPGAAATSSARAVTNELVAVLHWLGQTHAADLKPQVFTHTARLFVAMKDDLRTLTPAERLAASRMLARDSALPIRAVGITGLLDCGSPEGIKRFSAAWPQLQTTADSQNLVKALGKYTDTRDAAAIRALGQLASLRSAFPQFDQSIAYILRNLHTKDALPGLAAFLDSPSPIARSFAVTGMCLFVRNAATIDPGPSDYRSAGGVGAAPRPPAPFMTAETERYCRLEDAPQDPDALKPFLAFWKTWWQAHQASFL